ncbi:MAG: hypothetical protein ACYCWW_02295, partial [Deltaproteobacteria bacterium]
MGASKVVIAPRSSVPVLVAGMCGVGLLFVAMAGLYVVSARTGSRETEGLLSTAVPGAVMLTSARSRLRELDSALARARLSSQGGQGLDASGALSARRAFGRAVDAYRALPQYDGERLLKARVVLALDRLDGLLGRLIDALRRDDGRTVAALDGEWRR